MHERFLNFSIPPSTIALEIAEASTLWLPFKCCTVTDVEELEQP